MRWRAGRSLFSVLFVSIASVALSIYLLMQLLLPDGTDRSIPLGQRLTAAYFMGTIRDSGVPVAVFIVLVMITIWIVLQLTLAPVRQLSEHAHRISPANLNERLPAAEAPAEIAPLVEAFNASLDRLEDAWKAQRAFSANAAHELRTPLAALRAQVESLLPEPHRAEAADEFERLSRIISQLLVLSEGEHGALRRTGAFDLVEIVKIVTMECAPAFVRSGRLIELDLPVRVLPRRGDAVLVSIALRNLLENAFKHTPSSASVSVGLDGQGVISVEDNGPGLPSAFVARAFQPFARADPNGTGAGLGLSIVGRVAELHGGRAWLEEGGAGAHFKVHIP